MGMNVHGTNTTKKHDSIVLHTTPNLLFVMSPHTHNINNTLVWQTIGVKQILGIGKYLVEKTYFFRDSA